MSPANAHKPQSRSAAGEKTPSAQGTNDGRETSSGGAPNKHLLSENEQSTLQAASQALNDAKEEAANQAAGGQENAQQLADTARAKADDVAGKLEKQAEGGEKTAQSVVSDAVDATKEGAQQVRCSLRKNANAGEGQLNSQIDSFVDTANQKMKDAKDAFDEIKPEHTDPGEVAGDVKSSVTKATRNAQGKIEEKGAVDNFTTAVCNTATASKLVALGASDAALARVHGGRELVINTVLTLQNTAEEGLAYLRDKLLNAAAVTQEVANDVAEDVSSGTADKEPTAEQVRTEVEKAKGRAMGAVNTTSDAVLSAVQQPKSTIQGAKEQAQRAGSAAQQLPETLGEAASEVAEGVGKTEESQTWNEYICSKTHSAYSAVKSRVEQEAASAQRAKQNAQSKKQERLDRAWDLQQEAFVELKTGVHHTYSGAKSKLTAAVQ